MRKWSERSLRNLKGIHPDLRRVMDRALQESPLDFVVIEGLRTKERQKQLVDSGASKTMASRHITGHAVDIMPIDISGTPRFDWNLYRKIAPAIKNAAKVEQVPITWGGDWKSFPDGPHWELSSKAYPIKDWKTEDKPVERTISQSKTMRASAAEIGAGAATAATAIGALDGDAQVILLIVSAVIIVAGIVIMRERIKKWLGGDR